MVLLFAIDQEIFRTLRNTQFSALDAGERLERGTCRPATVGAVAVQGIRELICNGIANSTAKALSGKRMTAVSLLRVLHSYSLFAD